MTAPARGAAISLAFTGALHALGFVTSAAVAWLLPVAEYGRYGVAMAVAGVVSIFLTAGYPVAAMRSVSRGGVASEETRDAFWNGVAVNLLVVGAAAIGTLLLVRLGVLALAGYGGLVLIALTISATTAVGSLARASLQGALRFSAWGVLSVVEALALLALILGLLRAWPAAAGAVVANAVASAIGVAIALALLRRHGLAGWRGTGVRRDVHAFAATALVGSAALLAMQVVDILALRALAPSGDEAAGVYQASLLLTRPLSLLVTSLAIALSPYFTRGERDEARLREYTTGAMKYVLILLFPVALMLAARPDAVIDLVYPERYGTAAPVLRVLAVAAVAASVASLLATRAQAVGQPMAAVRATWTGLAVQLVLLVLLVPKWEQLGAAAAFLGGTAVASAFLLRSAAKAGNLRIRPRRILAFAASAGAAGAVAIVAPIPAPWIVVPVSLGVALLFLAGLMMGRVVGPADVHVVLSGVLPRDSRVLQAIVRGVERMRGERR